MVESSNRGAGQLIAGAGGVLLIASLFLPWAEKGGVSRSGWELWTMADVFFLIAGLNGLHSGRSAYWAALLAGVVILAAVGWVAFSKRGIPWYGHVLGAAATASRIWTRGSMSAMPAATNKAAPAILKNSPSSPIE